MQNTTLDLSADIIDIRDIIERFEEIESELLDLADPNSPTGYDTEQREYVAELQEEHKILEEILEELKGYGGDEQWRGDWYPVTLIRDDYFSEHVQDLLADCGELPRDIPSYIEIDWEATAQNIQADYSSVDIDGETYWYR